MANNVTPGCAEEVLDRKTALARVDGDGEIMCSLIDIFLEQIGGMMDAIREAIKSGNADQLEKSAHRLKGSISIFSAETATQVAFELEKTGCSGDLQHASETLARLEQQITLFKPALENFRKELQPRS
jgi:HPt (histidine-containing phosphotransfer) domain-containing protein